MSVVAIIPARGGSKRIPRKNIKYFFGRPIIAYSIEVALNSGLFDRVIVSTDDEETAEVSISYGAEVPFFRPKEIADDITGTDDVVRHALEYFLLKNKPVSLACCIYATAPFLESRYLVAGHQKLLSSEKSFVFSVTRYPSPIQRALRLNECGEIEAIWDDNIKLRSQDLPETYHDAGQFYWGRAEAFLQKEVIFSSVSLPVILPRYNVIDIDTEEDWYQAELFYKVMQLNRRPEG